MESERMHYKQMIASNKMYLATAKKLGEERLKLLEEIAMLRGNALLDKKEIKRLRQEVAAHDREKRDLLRGHRKEVMGVELRVHEAQAIAEAAEVEAALQTESARQEAKRAAREAASKHKKAVHDAAVWRNDGQTKENEKLK